MPSASREFDFAASYSRFVVKHTCCAFWLSLSCTLLLCGVGIVWAGEDAKAKGQSGILSKQTGYDWTVTGALLMKQKDMVDSALGGRDRDELKAVAERTQEYHGRFSFQFLYYWKDGRQEDMWTADTLQQMCEVENVILSTPGYEKLCLSASVVPFLSSLPHPPGLELRASFNSSSGVRCSLPHMSAVSLFYQEYEEAADLGKSDVFEIFYGARHAAAPTQLLSEDLQHTRDCSLLDEAYVAARRARLYEIALSKPEMRAQIGYFLSSAALEDEISPRTEATRSMISFGSPLPGFSNSNDREEEQQELVEEWSLLVEQRLFDHFKMQKGLFYSAYRDPAETTSLRITFLNYYLYSPVEFGRLASEDFNMVLGSMCFVGLYMGYHTGSLFLALLGLLQILLSLPLALFFYTCFRFTWFSQVHILSVFVVLGVGADDIFVFVDAWRQSASMPTPISSSVTSRLIFTQRRATSAVFNTSLTTAIAFFATGVSPIMPLAAFGTYAALAIVMNFLLMVFWWPAVMMVWELHLRGARLCGCCIICSCCPCAEAEGPQSCFTKAFWTTKPMKLELPHATPVTPVREAGEVVEGEVVGEVLSEEASRRGMVGEVASLSTVERFFHKVYAPALARHVGSNTRLKPVSLALIVLCGGMSLGLISQAVQMTPPTKEEVWFPKGHMLARALEEPREQFLAGDDEMYTVGHLYFGLKDLDNSAFDRFDPSENRGDVQYDTDFSLEDPAAQASFLGFCDSLDAADCGLEACTRPPHTLVYELRCFLRAFADSYGGAANLPQGAAFTTALRNWLPSEYESDVGFVDGKVKYARIEFKMTMSKLQPSFKVRPVYELFLSLIDAQLAGAPAGMQSAFAYTGREFVWMGTQESLVDGVFVGFAICFPVAFLVLLCATGSFTVAVFAIATIAAVVGSLLGFVSACLGWELGTGEAIAATIVIGLSVDYTVHLGHMYVEAGEPSREGKLNVAATNMGVTVVAGGVTTFGSAIFMYACQLSFFSKMATLIAGTIAFSLLYSLFFFMPLMAVFGPEGELRTAREQLVFCRRRLMGNSSPAPGAQKDGGDKEMTKAKAGGAGAGLVPLVTPTAPSNSKVPV